MQPTGGSRKIRTGHERLFKLRNSVKINKTNTLKYCARKKRPGAREEFPQKLKCMMTQEIQGKKFLERQTNNKNNRYIINQR